MPYHPRKNPKTIAQRWCEKVVLPADSTGCWLWSGGHTTGGYGTFTIRRPLTTAHRVGYELFVGPIPQGLEIDHLCRNRGCVNPDHLEPVTRQVNMRRGIAPAADRARQTHCIHGHEFTDENTYIRKNGCRSCRACNSARYLSQRVAA